MALNCCAIIVCCDCKPVTRSPDSFSIPSRLVPIAFPVSEKLTGKGQLYLNDLSSDYSINVKFGRKKQNHAQTQVM